MTPLHLADRYDVVVVGARCAGAATAMLLARSGLRVLVIDRSPYGSDTLSTHALMRGGVLQLQRWGVLPTVTAAATPPVRETTFHYGADTLRIAISPRHGVDALYAPRRYVLDRALADAAVAAGAEIRYGLRVVDLLRSHDGSVAGVVAVDSTDRSTQFRSRLVIGADGLRSSVARLAGARAYRVGRHASGVAYAYWKGLEVDGYHWHWGDLVAAGAIPTNDGETCVFASVPAERFHSVFSGGVEAGYRRVLLEAAPEVAATLGASPDLHTFSGQAGFIRQSWGPGWALTGDAGCFKDPITAHGITDALRDAELLARAVVRGTADAFSEYQRTRDELVGEIFELSDRIASFDWDIDSVRPLHEALAKAMSAEVKSMAAWEPAPNLLDQGDAGPHFVDPVLDDHEVADVGRAGFAVRQEKEPLAVR